jgi:tetratricopeptide (TPR) repeat protein
MRPSRRIGALLGLVVALGGLLGVAEFAGAQPGRDRALADLGNQSSVEARRRGAEGLGHTGAMEDLVPLAHALRDVDSQVRAEAERAMWQVWSRSGDAEADRLLAVGIQQINAGAPEAAIETFSRVIRLRPEFAEAWNKRATVYYLVGDYQKSLADCDEVMKRNRFHFGALSGYGMIYLQLGLLDKSLSYFEQALQINPNLETVEETAQMLRRLLKQRRQDTI